jgi:hypothetical protein
MSREAPNLPSEGQADETNTRSTGPGNPGPLLFVDVDGVISLFGFDPDYVQPGGFHWVNGVLHYISSGCGKRLLRLAERFDLVWATGWEHTANEYLPHLLGLPGELPCLTFDGRASYGTAHWKLDAIATYAGDRSLAWIDDCHDDSCHQWADGRPAPTLLVSTASCDGLCDEHVERLLGWAAEL